MDRFYKLFAVITVAIFIFAAVKPEVFLALVTGAAAGVILVLILAAVFVFYVNGGI